MRKLSIAAEVKRMGQHLYKTGNLFKSKPPDVYQGYVCEKYTEALRKKKTPNNLAGKF